jgi:outer membrane lipase/esterase
MTTRILTCTALAIAALLSACGGGDDGPGPKTDTRTVRVAGDDQGDAGTFGFKFTVQDSANPKGYPIFTELVAASLKAPAICNHYNGINGSVSFTTQTGCTSMAIAGSRINFQPTLANQLRTLPLIGEVVNNAAPVGSPVDQVLTMLPGLGSVLANLPSLPLVGAVLAGVLQPIADQLPGATAATTPLLVDNQLKAMATQGLNAQDVVILIAGSNDAADVATAFLQASIDQGIAFTTLMGSMGVTNTDRRAAGNEYMAKLADKYYAGINTHLLAKGATKIAILNMPNVVQTPRLSQARATIQGAEAAVPMLIEWVETYNNKLAANINGDKRFIQINYRKLINDAITDPNLLVSNSDTPACPSTGTGTLDMLPTYDLKSCTSGMLSSNPPQGQTSADWWTRYFFADSTHPTPYLHNLLARGVNLELVRAGIL